MTLMLALVRAFLTGGFLCAAAQILIDRTRYRPIMDFAGAGASVPLTGFGYLISEGVREAVAERGALGILTGPLTAASGGIAAALGAGLLAALLFDSRVKD